MSCISATACTAVGSYSNNTASGVYFPLAEKWNGTNWTIEPTPNPAGATLVGLDDVSCTSATACTAVGGYYTASPPISATLAEQWNGTNWTIEPTPNPAGTTAGQQNGLDGVSCTSATACTAVRAYFYQPSLATPAHVDGIMAERWNGTTWTIQPTPTPAGANSPKLIGVSCTSATACTAVGTSNYSFAAKPSFTLAERWNGTAWAIQPTPTQAGAESSSLNGVSCTSATACTAVGGGSEILKSRSVPEQWNGTNWTIEPTPAHVGAKSSLLIHVRCTSASECTAVGFSSKTTKVYFTLGEHST